jgi:hypothetical protein
LVEANAFKRVHAHSNALMDGTRRQERREAFAIGQGNLALIDLSVFKAFERIAGRAKLEHFALGIGKSSEHGVRAINPHAAIGRLILARRAWTFSFPGGTRWPVTTRISATIAATLFWTKT